MRTVLFITAIMCVMAASAIGEDGLRLEPAQPVNADKAATLAELILNDKQEASRGASGAAMTATKLSEDSPTKESVQFSPVNSIGLNIAPSEGRLPEDVAATAFAEMGMIEQHGGFIRQSDDQSWTQTQYCWVTPWVAYNPLYFDDPRLERDGNHFGFFEPVVSAAKFYGRIPFLPYMVGSTDPYDCVYSYGKGRPGDCAPYYRTLPKFSARGAAYQAAAVTGGVLILP